MQWGIKLLITIKEVAKKAGVHPSVVSRVLNKDHTLKIKDSTRKRIINIVDELEYVPNHSARNLKKNETKMIGMVIPDFNNPVYSSIIHGAESQATEEGYSLLVYSMEQKEMKKNYFSHLIEGRIDGLLVAISKTEDKDIFELQSIGKPFVLVNRFMKGIENYVVLDDKNAGRTATAHLKDMGHSKIAHITGPLTTGTGSQRMEGFKEELLKGGLEIPDEYIQKSSYTIEDGYHSMNILLNLENPPSAVFAANILISLGAMKAIQDRNLKIPGDISVIGIHDVMFAATLYPPLTTVKMPLYEMGQKAVGKIISMIKDKSDPEASKGIIIKGEELIERESTGPPKEFG